MQIWPLALTMTWDQSVWRFSLRGKKRKGEMRWEMNGGIETSVRIRSLSKQTKKQLTPQHGNRSAPDSCQRFSPIWKHLDLTLSSGQFVYIRNSKRATWYGFGNWTFYMHKKDLKIDFKMQIQVVLLFHVMVLLFAGIISFSRIHVKIQIGLQLSWHAIICWVTEACSR